MKELMIRTTISDPHLEIPVSFIDQYLAKASGLALKVYLYLVRASKDASIRFSVGDLSVLFDEMPNKILTALGYWAGQGLLTMEYDGEELSSITLTELRTAGVPDEMPAKAPVVKETTIQRIPKIREVRAAMEDEEVQAAVSFVLPLVRCYTSAKPSERVKNALKEAFVLLNRDTDLLEYLIESLAEAKTLTEKAILERAKSWAEAGVSSIAEAKTLANPSKNEIHAVFDALGIRNRTASPSETETVKRWLSSFDLALVLEACARTVNTIHAADFHYVEGILSRWQKAGVRTSADVAEEDEKHRARAEKKKPEARQIRTSFVNYEERNTDYEALFAVGET